MTTLLQLTEQVRTEADAYRYLERLRWPSGLPRCPHCDHDGADYIEPRNGISRATSGGRGESQRRVWRCWTCRKQFSVLTGTIMHGTKASIRMWVIVLFEMCLSKNGVAAFEIHRKYGVCQRTAWFMLHRIREAMDSDVVIGRMAGVIVADETYFGGEPKNWHASKRKALNSHPGQTQKTPILTLINKHTGEARSRVMPRVTGRNLARVLMEEVDPLRSLLHTDSSDRYDTIGRKFAAHETVDHHRGEYVRGDVSTNLAEGFFSQLKRSIDGTHHHVSVEHLARYVNEFDFRYSTRKLNDTERMQTLADRLQGKRLTYKLVKTP